MLSHIKPGSIVLLLVFSLIWAGCADEEEWTAADPEGTGEMTAEAAADLPEEQQEFWNRLQDICGQAFRGEIIEDTEEDEDFEGDVVMHVRQCTDDTIHIPFHIGDDRSRTWVFSKTDEGALRLKHDHRYEDGTEEEVTQYGGDTDTPGTPTRQEFPADPYTGELIPYAATNVWTVEIDDEAQEYVYTLHREDEDDDRYFQARFDLSETVEPPEAPWGYEDTEPTHN